MTAQLMTTVLASLGSLALGSLLTLSVQALLYRTKATQIARRELYIQMGGFWPPSQHRSDTWRLCCHRLVV